MKTKNLRKVLAHLLGDTQAVDVRSLICVHLRNLRIELLFLGLKFVRHSSSPEHHSQCPARPF
jgi:hypothetical protein